MRAKITLALLFGATALFHAGQSAVVCAQTVPVRPPDAQSASTPVVVRGWEIQSVLAVRRAGISEISPRYEKGARAGEEKKLHGPKKGTFLVVQIQCKWASLQPPNERLWVGKPDVVLVDAQGNEYPVVDALARQAGEYVTVGMIAGPNRKIARKELPPETNRQLAYFDVPPSARSLSLRFSDGGPVLPVQEVPELPDSAVDLPE